MTRGWRATTPGVTTGEGAGVTTRVMMARAMTWSQSNNGQSNNGQSNNGQSNNGQSNNGQGNNGQSNNGQSNNSLPWLAVYRISSIRASLLLEPTWVMWHEGWTGIYIPTGAVSLQGRTAKCLHVLRRLWTSMNSEGVLCTPAAARQSPCHNSWWLNEHKTMWLSSDWMTHTSTWNSGTPSCISTRDKNTRSQQLMSKMAE